MATVVVDARNRPKATPDINLFRETSICLCKEMRSVDSSPLSPDSTGEVSGLPNNAGERKATCQRRDGGSCKSLPVVFADTASGLCFASASTKCWPHFALLGPGFAV